MFLAAYNPKDKIEEIQNASNDSKVITAEEAKDFKDNIRHTVKNLKNPYDDFFHWCKNELYDIRAAQECLAIRLNHVQ